MQRDSKAAKVSAVELLHSALVEKFRKMLEGGEVSAAELNTIRQFLKDNDVQAAPESVQDLADKLGDMPFPGELDDKGRVDTRH